VVLERFGPVEPFVWRDPYVMAYVTEVVHGLLKEAAGTELQPKVCDLAFRRCCERLTGIPATDLPELSADPRLRQRREFQRGSDDGLLCLAFLDGKLKPGMRSQFVERLVDEARLFGENFETGTDEKDATAMVVPYLLTRDLISRMRAVNASRLAPSW